MTNEEFIDFKRRLNETPSLLIKWMLHRATFGWSYEKIKALFDLAWAQAEMDAYDEKIYKHRQNQEMISVNHEYSEEADRLANEFAEKWKKFHDLKS